jgi:membrane-associated phospholipid phosphatase
MLTRPRSALLAALACLLGLALTGLLTYAVEDAQLRDTTSLEGYTSLGSPRVDAWASRAAHLADPGPYAVFAVALIVIALARRRVRLAVAVALVVFLAPVTSETLKPLLAHERPADWLGSAQITAASWPSGHATASMTIALCAVLVAPAVLRPLAAVAGALYALGVSFSILVLHWHFPSDVVGGFFSAAMWTLLAVAVLRRWPDPLRGRAAPVRPAVAAAPAIALAGFAALVVVAVALDRPRALLAHVAERPTFTFSAIVIAALAAVLAGGLARGARADR